MTSQMPNQTGPCHIPLPVLKVLQGIPQSSEVGKATPHRRLREVGPAGERTRKQS